MSYTPTVWSNGDTVTAAKLNKLENGVANGGVLVVTETVTTVDEVPIHTLSNTYNEIITTPMTILKKNQEGVTIIYPLVGYRVNNNTYEIVFSQSDTVLIYACNQETDYPSYSEDL